MSPALLFELMLALMIAAGLALAAGVIAAIIGLIVSGPAAALTFGATVFGLVMVWAFLKILAT